MMRGTKPTSGGKRRPISMRTQKALLQTLKARAEAGDVPAIEALVRLNMTARSLLA